jgi:enamine deaminase RidA (YjgF/YER057c/UK114 family)
MTLANVVKVNVYLTNLARDFDAVNEAYKELMPDPKPARTCVGVQQLPTQEEGTDVEMEMIAYDG